MFFITCIVLLVAARDTRNEWLRQEDDKLQPTKSTFYGGRHEEGGSDEGGSDQLAESQMSVLL